MPKLFTIKEANQLIPKLADFFLQANSEVKEKRIDLYEIEVDLLDVEYEKREKVISGINENLAVLEKEWHFFAKKHKQAKHIYLSLLNKWAKKISSTGVILKSLEDETVHFLSYFNGKEVYLCWMQGEEIVSHWHESKRNCNYRRLID